MVDALTARGSGRETRRKGMPDFAVHFFGRTKSLLPRFWIVVVILLVDMALGRANGAICLPESAKVEPVRRRVPGKYERRSYR